MNKLFQFKELLVSFYGLIRLARSPKNTKYVFIIGNAQDRLAEEFRTKGQIDNPFDDPNLEQLWKENYHPAKYDLDELAKLPMNTLGYNYSVHMKKNNLDPEYYHDTKPLHPMHYLRLRIRKTHDIWHLLAGYDTSLNGEMGLQGVYFAEFTNGQSAMILAGGVFKALFAFDYKQLEDYIFYFVEGYNKGKKCLPLLPVKWEEYWEEDLAGIRKRLLLT
jgi:ubiquinone biosynthesis protein COQ4